MTKAVKGFVKSVPLVWGLAVRLLVVPGVIRASVGVDCLVPCPPSVAPRTLNPGAHHSSEVYETVRFFFPVCQGAKFGRFTLVKSSCVMAGTTAEARGTFKRSRLLAGGGGA